MDLPFFGQNPTKDPSNYFFRSNVGLMMFDKGGRTTAQCQEKRRARSGAGDTDSSRLAAWMNKLR